MRLPATFCFLLMSILAAVTAADEPPVSDADVLRAAYREEAERHEFMLADGAKLKLAEAPLMHWSNYGGLIAADVAKVSAYNWRSQNVIHVGSRYADR
jgi:hypothetical protein